MDKTSDLTIKYSHNESVQGFATYNEFMNMRATIDYYKELLESSNLSPVEKVAYVYDILKTMRYQESSQDKSRSRNIHSIVTDGTIVCVGYSVFAKQLLNEVGIHCQNVSVTCLNEDNKEEGHQRNFVRVDDDKYNIHGLFAMDITWDSDKDISIIEENGQRIITSRPNPHQRKIIDTYDSLVLYRYFLTPMDSYEIRYPNEINPTIYEIYKSGQVKDLIEEYQKVSAGEITKSSANNIFALEQHAELFSPSEDLLTVESYLHATKPSLETFKEIIRNVRIAEGYQKEEATEDVERVVELHQMLREQNPNSPDNFFKSSQTK